MSTALERALLIHAVDRAPDGVLIVDERGEIHFANDAMAKLVGCTVDELTGRSVDDLVPDSLRATHAAHREGFVAHPSQRPMGSGLELSLQREDRTLLPVEISLSPIEHHGRRYVVAAVRDVTERRENQHRLQAATEQLTLVNERARIGRDLHDVVLQHLYGMGLSVQAIASAAGAPVASQLEPIVASIDRVISEVRTIVFTLGTTGRHGSLGQELADVMAQSSRVLGFTPSIRLEGPVESVVTDEVCAEMVASMREALGNVARHAQATRVDVLLEVGDHHVTMTVTDNGIGPPDDPSPAIRGGHGVLNMQERAASLGGSCTLASGVEGGAVLTWSAPFN